MRAISREYRATAAEWRAVMASRIDRVWSTVLKRPTCSEAS